MVFEGQKVHKIKKTQLQYNIYETYQIAIKSDWSWITIMWHVYKAMLTSSGVIRL